jgi:delta 1-pyrroline-5-carboxylate dehydrogenase
MEMTMPAVTKIREDQTAPKKERMLIRGEWVGSASGEWLEVEDPAHRRPVAEVPRGRSQDVACAVKAAADAFPAWSRTVPREHGRLLARIAEASYVVGDHGGQKLAYVYFEDEPGRRSAAEPIARFLER